MAVSQQKLKTFRVMQILMEKTDENHSLSAQGIIEILENRYGMTADRKSIYSDVELLKEVGVDIVQQKGTNPGYYVGSRDFELPELKLLVDAVQSSKFITAKKSEALIDKLKKQTNEEYAKQLQRQVYIDNRIKADNETIYYNVDKIHTAIFDNKQIRFKYAQWATDGKMKFRRNGDFYVESPWALLWVDENYYLVAYDEEEQKTKHFRVDKMRQMEICEEGRLGADKFKTFDSAEYTKKTFGMFDGKEEFVTLICKNNAIGIAIDRFGKDIHLREEDADHTKISTTVKLSNQFYGWLTGVGREIQIKSPEWVKEEYQKYLKDILAGYEE